MEKISKLFTALFIGLFAVSLTACSDDDNGGGDEGVIDPYTYPSAAPTSLEDVVTVYLNDVIYPTYTSLANHAQVLYEACNTLYQAAEAGTMTQAQIDAACEAFSDARVDWERSEAWLYGAASDHDIDPHIDSWPLDQTQMRTFLTNPTMVAGIKGSNPALFVRENNAVYDTALGFHGMEFVLFRDGGNRTLEALSQNETMEGMTSVAAIDELAFLAAVAADLRDKCFQLEYCWLGDDTGTQHITHLQTNCTDITATELVSPFGNSYGADMLATGSASQCSYPSWQNCANNIFIGGCSNICQEVYSQKLGQAYRVATGQGGEDDASDYIESPYSKRSFRDYRDNIYSIKNSLFGSTDITLTTPLQNSLLNYLKKNGYSRTANLSASLQEAIDALTSAMNSGIAFVDDPGNRQVQECITAVNALDDELNQAGRWIARQL